MWGNQSCGYVLLSPPPLLPTWKVVVMSAVMVSGPFFSPVRGGRMNSRVEAVTRASSRWNVRETRSSDSRNTLSATSSLAALFLFRLNRSTIFWRRKTCGQSMAPVNAVFPRDISKLVRDKDGRKYHGKMSYHIYLFISTLPVSEEGKRVDKARHRSMRSFHEIYWSSCAERTTANVVEGWSQRRNKLRKSLHIK